MYFENFYTSVKHILALFCSPSSQYVLLETSIIILYVIVLLNLIKL